MKTIRRTTWNTFQTTCYTHDVAQDQRSAGGTHNRQVRWNGHQWEMRIRQSNGANEAYSQAWGVTDAEGEAAFEKAKKY
jgi:hypothetical protein